MDVEILKTVGQIAGIGGLSLGVFLLLFRDLIGKSIFPTLTKEHSYRLLRLITMLIWSVAVLGLAAWAWVETRPPGGPANNAKAPSATAETGIANTGTQTFQGPVAIGTEPATEKASQ